mmetsp:Transcript_21236/g.23642  ORF Transcript_21236/g.23642 Transcript_21236/m.23642 type:complete len:89 (+) Transcript_21236:30-296(+)|eukprot:CAMPEP_0205821052 /NCGR_PEP_ID=MMETSP0206-20130828/4795_1 /ASSEMBLY_ACC=CAM_ASM_000279 /TAXON_ID=36767 /ORGANISM="Euplotes focardii, Strain TN1" /LENGTH=88 /DNA_ID=CAMNT_0053116241 /DNA_START=30 /DNA_END=296 /DNA_ORIENTATION=+
MAKQLEGIINGMPGAGGGHYVILGPVGDWASPPTSLVIAGVATPVALEEGSGDYMARGCRLAAGKSAATVTVADGSSVEVEINAQQIM